MCRSVVLSCSFSDSPRITQIWLVVPRPSEPTLCLKVLWFYYGLQSTRLKVFCVSIRSRIRTGTEARNMDRIRLRYVTVLIGLESFTIVATNRNGYDNGCETTWQRMWNDSDRRNWTISYLCHTVYTYVRVL